MSEAQVVALVAFVLVAAILAVLLRRSGRFLATTRRVEGFIGDVGDLEARVATSLSELATLVDTVRRGDAEPESLLPSLAACAEATERYVDEARRLGAPPEAVAAREAMVAEIERAGRAIELIEHGCRLATAGRRLERGPETETSIKRGYLNLIHARESITELTADAIASAEAASPVRRLFRREPPAQPPG